MNMLVVEGNRGISQLLTSFLRICGHDVDDANNGREALRMLQGRPYDIVITDSEIIGIDGAELCKIIKSQFPGIYVIGMSGYPSVLKDLREAGADICFSKPFDMDKLKEAIDLGISSRAAASSQDPSRKEE